jgi:hypothetical protein
MTELRDILAAAALPAVIANNSGWHPKQFAQLAYELADAMLQARAHEAQ